jgi:hypothetical protein
MRFVLPCALLFALLPQPSLAALENRSESGPVAATIRVEPATPVIGDPITLEIEVRAETGVELLMPEFGEALDRFDIVDYTPREWIDDAGKTVSVQRYTLQPTRSGALSIPPIAIEFIDRRPGRPAAPDGEDAFELLTERLQFEVSSVLAAGDSLELRPAKPALAPRERPGAPLWPILLAAVVLIGAASPFALRALARHRARAAQRSAYQIATDELDALLAGARPHDASQMDRFFVQLSGIVRRYLESRFQLRSPELTTEEFLVEIADSPDLSTVHQKLLQVLLQRADLVKFAHLLPDREAVADSVGAAQRFISETRALEVSIGA